MTKFLVDQQLPHALAVYLVEHGHNARHIKEYPGGMMLEDAEIARIADAEERIILTKDDDFRVLHLLENRPARLVHVTCGNISTSDLIALIQRYYDEFVAAVGAYRFVELDRPGVIIHDPS